MSTQKILNRAIAITMDIQGVSILGMWISYIAGGAFRDGVRTIENNMYLGLHVAAETIMGLLLIVGSVGLLTNRTWGAIYCQHGYSVSSESTTGAD